MEAKQKRIKKVFSDSAQVFHLWANQSQEYARQGGRLTRAYFEGRSCYSYGSHYELGRIIEYKGKKVGIVNNTGYSHTTGEHIRQAYCALDGLMPRILSSTFSVREALIENQEKFIDELMSQFSRNVFYRETARESLEYTLEQIKEFNEVCETLGHKELQIIPCSEYFEILDEHVKVRREKQSVKRREQEKKRQEEIEVRKIKEQENIEKWKAGDSHVNISFLRPMLIRIKNNTVQTSSGAEVPLKDAVAFIQRLKEGKVKKGEEIGSFTFDSIDKGILKIGCHTFDIEHVTEVLNKFSSQQTQSQQTEGLRLIQGGK